MHDHALQTDRLDEYLRRALILANSPQALGLDRDPAPSPPSKVFQKRMEKLLADPAGWVKKQARPRWMRVLRTVACAALIAALALGTVLAVSPAAREWVHKIVVEWFDDHAEFRLEGEAVPSSGHSWQPTWLPDGYQEISFRDDNSFVRRKYEDENKHVIRFQYKPMEQGNYFNVDNEHGVLEEVTVNGLTAHLIRSTVPGWPSHLTWSDGSTAFLLSGEVPSKDLLAIAESVTLEKDFLAD